METFRNWLTLTNPNPKRSGQRLTPLQIALASGKRVTSFADVLDLIEPRPTDSDKQHEKKNYAQRMSEATAVLVADAMREYFAGILPSSDGKGQESKARTGKGLKKLDVNYSTPDLGLGLGVSIKTLNFKDPATGRYTKNPTRIDNELRAEAMDYHERQPYALLAGILFTPFDSCDDGDRSRPKQSRSSFAQIVNVLRHRSGRSSSRAGAKEDPQLFEIFFVGLYEDSGVDRGKVSYFNVVHTPPQFGRPAAGLVDLQEVVKQIVATYDDRNVVKPAWSITPEVSTLQELEDEGLLEDDAAEDDDVEGVT